jgi:hypothetical protein
MSRTFRHEPTDKHRERRPEGRFADHFELPTTERPAPVRRTRPAPAPTERADEWCGWPYRLQEG